MSKFFSMESIPQPRRLRSDRFEHSEADNGLYHPHHDPEYYRNGVDPIFDMTEAEFFGDVGDK